MAEHFPKLVAGTKPEIQERQKTPNRIKTKQHIQAYNIQTAENEAQK